jgi:hypothetical protein
LGRASSYTEKQKYTVFVLWLAGHTLTRISRVVGLTRGQVAGIVGRSPYTDRSAMTDEERGEFLDELKALKKDLMPGINEDLFVVRKLHGGQRR